MLTCGAAPRQEHEAAVKIGKAIREKKTHLLRQVVRYLGKPACLEVLEETLRIEVSSRISLWVEQGLGVRGLAVKVALYTMEAAQSWN